MPIITAQTASSITVFLGEVAACRHAISSAAVSGSLIRSVYKIGNGPGRANYNADQLSQRQDPVTWIDYLGAAEFWNRTLQNWQSELLAVGSFAVIAIFLRQRGSPESKRVGEEHAVTADSG